MNSEIILNQHQKPQTISAIVKYEVFPAIKIARLAVDKSLQRRGYGQSMIDWAIALIREKIVPHVGCRFIVVDSKQASVSFYENLGFELIDTKENKEDENPLMFFDIYKNEKV